MNQKHDPYWKIALNWGAVITFFTLPLFVFIGQLTIWPNLEAEKEHLDYLRGFMTNITYLVFGLAGLRTWEQIKANGNKQPNANKEWRPSEPPKPLETKL